MGASGGDCRDKGTGAAFVCFEMGVVAAVASVVRRVCIGYTRNFHDFGWEDVLADWKVTGFSPASWVICGISLSPSRISRPSHVADVVG